MKRREVWWVNFDPSVGGEIGSSGILSPKDMGKIVEAIKVQLDIY